MTIGVCGFGRCGSTMVMSMLAAGGVRCVPGAPPYELGDMSEAYRRTWRDDQAVKLLDCVLRFGAPPPARSWRFIWLDRDHIEQGQSQAKFLRGFGYDLAEDVAQRFAASYGRQGADQPPPGPRRLRRRRRGGRPGRHVPPRPGTRDRDREGQAMTKGIRVTVTDLQTGDTDTKDIWDDYLIIAAGSCEVTHINTYPTKGTHVLTVKGVKRT